MPVRSDSRLRHRLCRPRGERAAVAVFVAIIMVPVALGTAMISVDVGQLLWERREVQNAADAAVMAATTDCAKAQAKPCNPSVSSPSLTGLANGNARDNRNAIDQFCASSYLVTNAKTSLTECAKPTEPELTQCPALNPAYANYPFLEVRTSTRTATGNAISSKIASAIAGGDVSTTVGACARAVWGGLNSWPGTPIMPITMSYCEWAAATGANPATGLGGTYYPGPKGAYPGYDPATNPWPTGPEKEIFTAKTTSSPGCTDFNGHVAPGAFSALTQTGVCAATGSEWIQGDPGNDAACDDAVLQDMYRGKESLIPLFNCVSNTPDMSTCLTSDDIKKVAHGTKLNYHIIGYAGFYLSAWHLSSTSDFYQRSLRPPSYAKACPAGPARCLSGWFTQPVVAGGTIAPPGTVTFGPTVVLPAG